MICSAIDDLPLEQDLAASQRSEPPFSEPSGLSQQFENQTFAQEAEEQDSQSSHVDLRPITPDTSTQMAAKMKKQRTWYYS